MIETFGYLGSLCLAVCGVPQALLSYQQKHSNGISVAFLGLWTLGEIFLLIYIIPMGDVPLLFNYGANLVLLSVIWWYKIFPKSKQNRMSFLDKLCEPW